MSKPDALDIATQELRQGKPIGRRITECVMIIKLDDGRTGFTGVNASLELVLALVRDAAVMALTRRLGNEPATVQPPRLQ